MFRGAASPLELGTVSSLRYNPALADALRNREEVGWRGVANENNTVVRKEWAECINLCSLREKLGHFLHTLWGGSHFKADYLLEKCP
jgi:hypothetical protein